MASGHVPGSVNVPFPVLLTKDGRCESRLTPSMVSCGWGGAHLR